ncbi:hypothetical protein BMETH_2062_0 [methanotrophic bacterial endosymbiont of Bathymodiolus sp.]|nr:hypothetical protein BMETH_2062_0 [methanotrophic bacterial endosymbiont of Bathymodiolus sp.]
MLNSVIMFLMGLIFIFLWVFLLGIPIASLKKVIN